MLDIEKYLRNAQTTRQIFFGACIFFSQRGEFTLKYLVQNPFPEFKQVSNQPLEEFGKLRCLCREACVWEQGSSRESAFLEELSKDKLLSLTAALHEEGRRGSGRIPIRL